MIDVSLEYVRKALDQYLVNRYEVENNIVVLNSLVMPDGSLPQKNSNKVVITLVNLEYETSKQFYGNQQIGPQQANMMNPAVCFNLHILVSANFEDYSEALKFLTASIGFFQANSSMSRANYPRLPAGVNALKFEIENSPTNKMENIWMAMGAKYSPSIIYKVRQIQIQSDQISSVVPLVQDASSEVAH